MDDEIDRSSCVGKDFQTSECRGGSCHIDKGTKQFFFKLNAICILNNFTNNILHIKYKCL